MLVRRISLALLAFFLATASSFASICDVSCSFAAFHPVNHAGFGVLVHTNTTQIDHSCCRNRDQDQIAVPHLTMSPDCAVDPVLRLQLPMPPLVHGIAASVHGVQTIRFRPAGSWIADTSPPPLSRSDESDPGARVFVALRI